MATPIQSLSIKINKDPRGSLDYDTDLDDLKGGNYPDRLNVERNAFSEQEAETPTLGNRLIYSIPTQPPQNQQVRIYLDYLYNQVPPPSDPGQPVLFIMEIKLFNGARQLYWQRSTGPIAYSLSDVKQAVVSAFNLFPRPVTYLNGTNSNTEPYIDIEVDFWTSDFSVEVTDSFTGVPRVTEILREAISVTGAGRFNVIGKKDIMGVLWAGATTQTKDRELYRSISTLGRSSNGILCYVPNHGLSTGESVNIATVTGDGRAANGIWVIEVVSSDIFLLLGSVAEGFPNDNVFRNYGGVIYRYPFGLGLLGVQVYDPNIDSYTFTILAKSKKWNWTTRHQLDIDGELNNQGYLLNITDDYNTPTTFSYNGPFVENGAFTVINPKGLYGYENFGLEIQNLINLVDIKVERLDQIQTGGNVPAGNARYGVQLVTEQLSVSQVSLLTEPIPVFAPVYENDTDKVYGSVSPPNTGKINRVRVTGIPQGVFKFIDLIYFSYTSGTTNSVAIDSIVVRREPLNADQTEIILEHNGNETNSVSFVPADANFRGVDILKVGSLAMGENRLVYGKITTSSDLDISEWVGTFNYKIKVDRVFAAYDSQTFYEFYNPNQARRSYQLYEWYRFRICGRLRSTGAITKSAFFVDVRFVSQDDYNNTPEFKFFETNKRDRRIMAGDELVNYDLTFTDSEGGVYLNQYGIEVVDVDWNFQIDGIPARELFSEILLCADQRVDEVIAMGAFHSSQAVRLFNFDTQAPDPFLTYSENQTVLSTLYYRREFNPNTLEQFFINYAFNNSLGAFYSPDLLFGANDYVALPGDQLISFASYRGPIVRNGEIIPSISDSAAQAVITIWQSNLSSRSASINQIKESRYVTFGQSVNIDGKVYRKKSSYSVGGGTTVDPTYNGYIQSSHVLALSSPIIPEAGKANFGIYPSLIFRKRVEKYGSTNSPAEVFWQGLSIFADQSDGVCFGGDVFCQQTFIKILKNTIFQSPPETGVQGRKTYYSGSGYNIISSNRVNTNLRIWDPSDTSQLIYGLSTRDFRAWIGSSAFDYIAQNAGYQILNRIQVQTVYDPNTANNSEAFTRKYWSQLRPTNSIKNNYREILAGDFQDNPNTFGVITGLVFKDGELYTFQERGVTREFFNNRGRLRTLEDGDVNIGDGSVMSRPGIRETMLGTAHKWSIEKGFSPSGKEIVVWANAEYACIMRRGSDGTVNLSERDKITTFLAQRMRFVQNKFTPAHDQGIHTTWDHIGRNFIITARGWKDLPVFQGGTYNQGSEVIFREEYGIPIIYKALITTTQEPGSGSDWQRIPISDYNYYSVWTLVYNTENDGFTHRYSWYPKIYLTQSNRFFSPSPILGDENNVYRHRDEGARILNFYGDDHEGYSDWVVNFQPSLLKKFVAMAYNSLLKPYKVDVQTEFNSENRLMVLETQMTRDQFTMREGAALVGIRKSFDSQGKTNGNTPEIKGLWARIRTYFKAGERQRINDTVVSVKFTQRNSENP